MVAINSFGLTWSLYMGPASIRETQYKVNNNDDKLDYIKQMV